MQQLLKTELAAQKGRFLFSETEGRCVENQFEDVSDAQESLCAREPVCAARCVRCVRPVCAVCARRAIAGVIARCFLL